MTTDDHATSPETADRITTAQKWVLFAGLMFAYAALGSLIVGVAELAGAHFALTGTDYILVHSVHTPGWAAFCLALLQYVAAFLIWTALPVARWFGIVLAIWGFVGALMMSASHPIFALTLLIANGLILSGLGRYGGTPA